jgi:hypothetical protein
MLNLFGNGQIILIYWKVNKKENPFLREGV